MANISLLVRQTKSKSRIKITTLPAFTISLSFVNLQNSLANYSCSLKQKLTVSRHCNGRAVHLPGLSRALIRAYDSLPHQDADQKATCQQQQEEDPR